MASDQNTEERLRIALADRYTIEREIGSGGMATVYLATDIRHERRVALKVLRPDLAASLGAERFLQEVRVTANLQHPHILPLFDSGEADGFLFYVMPYIEGESLRERLVREHELPVTEAVRLVRDVVDALAAAHRLGVVHRDIKPENVLISGRHAVVADFGVAKAVSEATGRHKLTTVGVALGTPSYMAPEQAAADEAIDHRADIYAVGAMAYELLTGRPPFTGGTAQQILAAQVMEAPQPVTALRASVPPALESLIMRCLEKKPADRWQSTEEMLPHLEAAATPSGGMTPTDMQPVTRSSLPLRRRSLTWLAGAGAAAVVALAAGYFVFSRGDSGMALLPEDLVAVFPFENLTGDPELDELGKITAHYITAGLTPVEGMRVRSADAVSAAMLNAGSESTKEEIALGLGAGVIVTGIITPEGESLQYHASITRVSSGEVLTAIEVLGARGEEGRMEGPDELRQRIMGAFAIALNPEFPATFPSSNPPSYDAYQALMRGLDLFMAGELSDAILYFDEASALDSTFMGPLHLVGWALLNLNRGTAVDSVLAILSSRREEMLPFDRLQLDYLTAVSAGDFEGSLEPLRVLFRQDPGMGGQLANSALHAGRPQEALDALESLSSVKQGGSGGFGLLTLALANSYLGRYGDALEAVREVQGLFPEIASLLAVRSLEIGVLAGLGRLEEIVAILDDVEGMEPDVGLTRLSPGQVFRHAAAALARAGYPEEARETAERAVGWYRTRDAEGYKSSIGLALLQAGRPEEALELFQQLVEQDSEVVSYRGYRGIALAQTGDTAGAEAEMSWLTEVVELRPRGFPTYLRAAILGHLGRKDEAARLLRQAIQEGRFYWYQQTGLLLWTDPIFEPLWGYEPFERVVGPQG